MRTAAIVAIALSGATQAQEGGAVPVSFDLATSCYQPQAIRWDVILLVLGARQFLAWLTAREFSEPAITIPTAMTAIFVLMPFQVSWFVNVPAMLWLSLVGEATPWEATAMVWALWFLILRGIEWIGYRAKPIGLGVCP